MTALITTSLVEIMGRWAIFVAITVFVFLNIPSSGAVYPVAAVPPFFGLLNQFHIGAALVDGLRAILYFHGNGIVEAVVTILAWTLAGLVLLALALAKKYRQQQATEESRQQGVEQQPEGSPETAS